MRDELTFFQILTLYHDITSDTTGICPIARHEGEGEMGVWIYDTRNEAIEAWNGRADNGDIC